MQIQINLTLIFCRLLYFTHQACDRQFIIICAADKDRHDYQYNYDRFDNYDNSNVIPTSDEHFDRYDNYDNFDEIYNKQRYSATRDDNGEKETNPWLIRKQQYEELKARKEKKRKSNKKKKKKKKKKPKEKSIEQIRLEEKIARRPKPTEVTLADFVNHFLVQHGSRKVNKKNPPASTASKRKNKNNNNNNNNNNNDGDLNTDNTIAKKQTHTAKKSKAIKHPTITSVQQVLYLFIYLSFPF
ncbi:hypothetical protein RFI_10026 [Reticulomyxa filosa]|uniref:Uncharacterized protein n=1 Tax=Reticulomyxa filosa TaxID=46433 RepID=X6NM68_RETFI|nr:hypothetical protein RFI_10026 [Reticulomyxa filosa]|eukprot:ETO27106.1 hypothetical protein RFI_10026 [Reticulomyxa filosa]